VSKSNCNKTGVVEMSIEKLKELSEIDNYDEGIDFSDIPETDEEFWRDTGFTIQRASDEHVSIKIGDSLDETLTDTLEASINKIEEGS
jgi:hypothetical protein